ncbi:MAG: hypothetical protein WC479_11205 [Candidatus Izemoplasmatales bacterium]
MGSGGGGSAPADTSTTVRYAPYIETRHQDFLNTIYSKRVAVIDESPFDDYTDIEVDDAFFGAGYTIASFPSLYDMFGKFMAGLDIDALFTQIYNDTIDSTVTKNLITAEGALIDDEIEDTSLPRLQLGLRDINSVISSTYATGKALLEDTRTKLVAKFSADLKYRLIPVAVDRWKAHLDWNKLVIGTYAEIMKLYYSVKTDVDEINYAMKAKDLLWPFTVLDFERAALGALQGATNSKTDVAGASTMARVLSGALTGAAMGAMVGGQITQTAATTVPTAAGPVTTAGTTYAGWGAGIGAALGVASAYTY